MEEIFDLQ